MEYIVKNRNPKRKIGTVMLTILGACFLALLMSIVCRDSCNATKGMQKQVEGAELIDSYTVADSAVMLKKTPSGAVYFQEYRKNLLLPLQETAYLCQLTEGVMEVLITTPLTQYGIAVSQEKIELVTQPEIGLHFRQFCQVYGWLFLLFFSLLCGIIFTYQTFRKIRRNYYGIQH